LGAYRAGNRGNNRGQDDKVRCGTLPEISQHKRQRAGGVTRKIVHAALNPLEEKENLSRIRSVRSSDVCFSAVRIALPSLRNNLAASTAMET
jgi:hypothetical protein